MIWLLRLILIAVWIPAQYVGVLLGALGGLAAQSKQASEPGTVVLGAVGLVAPALLATTGLWLSWQRPDLGAKVLVVRSR